MGKPLVFISYSKHDAQWKDRIRRALSLLQYSDEAETWSDERIDTGSEWYNRTKRAFGRCAVGILHSN